MDYMLKIELKVFARVQRDIRLLVCLVEFYGITRIYGRRGSIALIIEILIWNFHYRKIILTRNGEHTQNKLNPHSKIKTHPNTLKTETSTKPAKTSVQQQVEQKSKPFLCALHFLLLLLVWFYFNLYFHIQASKYYKHTH